MKVDGNIGNIAASGDKYSQGWKAIGAWFIGPRGENHDVFEETFKELLAKHMEIRKSYYPTDPPYFTDDFKRSRAYRKEIKDMKDTLMQSCLEMAGSVPFFSPRYQAHMCWETTIPSTLGYMSAMLLNQNNVDSAASPVTTLYEKTVGEQLCHMLGYNVTDKKDKNKPVGWGHITCGGSIANIEALWASRNLKFIPIAIKNALESEEATKFLTPKQVHDGLSISLFVYDKKECIIKLTHLENCDNWQLLNVDVDDICSLSDKIQSAMHIENDKDAQAKLNQLIEKEGPVSQGMFNFLNKNGLKQSPKYTVPANCHYSWPKAGTLLGLGSDALLPIQMDYMFRQDVGDLKENLNWCLSNEIPVLSVTAVIGSTEESAVDPIVKIFHLREEFKRKGLNFAILADGAWGGYFRTMCIKPFTDKSRQRVDSTFVPVCPLNDFAAEQYENIFLADTITIDPHKSGFCPYPSGALCYRNGKMRYPIAVYHPEVFHGEDDPTMGVYGIEGSKPGAAPAGVLMSHNVIGLDSYGYGRILGQCITTTKLFYCMWMVVARDDDPFICVPLQDLPDGYKLKDVKKMIKERMANKTMEEIYHDKEAFEFLKECGPDAAINTFGVNLVGNDSIEVANKLQIALSDAMNIMVGSSAKRVPIILMQSGFDAKKHGKGLKRFKKRLGLPEDEKDMNMMVNSCMNPCQSNESIFLLGEQFRLIVLNTIGYLEEPEVKHKFVIVSDIDPGDNTMFIEYITSVKGPNAYQVAAKVKVSDTDKDLLGKIYNMKPTNVFLETCGYHKLYDIMHSTKEIIPVNVIVGDTPTGIKINIELCDVPRYQRLDKSSTITYPEQQQYFIYGDKKRTIMSHVISKLPSFQQTVTLSEKPHSLTEILLDLGVMASVKDIEGEPLKSGGKIISPLQRDSYDITFKAEFYSTTKTQIKIQRFVFFNALQD